MPRAEVLAYTMYQWDCQRCSAVNTVEADPAGDDLECEGCGAEVTVTETR